MFKVDVYVSMIYVPSMNNWLVEVSNEFHALATFVQGVSNNNKICIIGNAQASERSDCSASQSS
jgi:hypothetical protein